MGEDQEEQCWAGRHTAPRRPERLAVPQSTSASEGACGGGPRPLGSAEVTWTRSRALGVRGKPQRAPAPSPQMSPVGLLVGACRPHVPACGSGYLFVIRNHLLGTVSASVEMN